MASISSWLAGARPRTMPAALAPVLAGSGAAASADGFSLPRAALAGAVALLLQIGVNYANDYSDGVKGTDEQRTGPMRLVASGTAKPGAVKAAALLAFALAAGAGLALVAMSGQWWLLAPGAAAIPAAWFYSGGRHPYGYVGLGDVGVFLFFGLVAVVGTCYTQALAVPWEAWAAAIGIGLLACALLMSNNLRDIATDQVAGKHTLAVRLGQRGARAVYGAEMILGLAAGLVTAFTHTWSLALVVLLPWAGREVVRVWRGATGRDLIAVLSATGLIELAYGAILAIALAL